MVRRAAAMALPLFLAACSGSGLSTVCRPTVEPSAAFLPAGADVSDGVTVIPNGRWLSPAGTQVEVGTIPLGIALSPDGETVVTSNNGCSDPEITTVPEGLPTGVDPQSLTFLKVSRLSDPPGATFLERFPTEALFVGLVFSPDGGTLYASGGGGNRLLTLASGPSGWTQTATTAVQGYPTGLALTPDGKGLLVTLLHDHEVDLFDVSGGPPTAAVQRFTVRAYPYGVAVSPDGRRAAVTNWGDGSVSLLDLVGGTVAFTVRVGKNPEGVAYAPDGARVYVANADEDSVSVVDPIRGIVTATWSLKGAPSDPPGISPVDLAVSPDGSRIYVACAGDNLVAVLSGGDGSLVGKIPVGYYPSGVRLSKDGTTLAVANAKGMGSGPNLENQHVVTLMRGTVSLLTVPSDAELAGQTVLASRNNDVTRHYFSSLCATPRSPIPSAPGVPSPVIRHVVLIVRENKTFDALLGDIGGSYPGAVTDPALVMFGEENTPNLHALVRRFVLLDNFYQEAEQSLQGHIWTAGSTSNDFNERMWLAMWCRRTEAEILLPGDEPASKAANGSFFDHLYQYGVSFRIYGEVTGLIDQLVGTYRDFVDLKYPVGLLGFGDITRANEFLREFRAGVFPSFVYLWLPEDHTYGAQAGKPTPQFMVADNDEGTGLIVEAISKSPHWKDTVIFVVEDDPQSTPDHVDAHRSILAVASPWVRNGYLSHVHYTVPSIHRTIELIFGIPPTSRDTALAPPLYDLFRDVPDPSSYSHAPRRVPFGWNPDGTALAAESARLDFSEVDQAPGLGRILWQAIKGPTAPLPAQLLDEGD